MQLLLNALDAPNKNAVKQNVPAKNSQSKHYDTSIIRKMLDEAFDNDELMDFIFDHFRPLYDQLSPGIPKKQTIQNLIAFAEEKNMFELLLDYVARKKPRQYRRFAGMLEIDEWDNDQDQWHLSAMKRISISVTNFPGRRPLIWSPGLNSSRVAIDTNLVSNPTMRSRNKVSRNLVFVKDLGVKYA